MNVSFNIFMARLDCSALKAVQETKKILILMKPKSVGNKSNRKKRYSLSFIRSHINDYKYYLSTKRLPLKDFTQQALFCRFLLKRQSFFFVLAATVTGRTDRGWQKKKNWLKLQCIFSLPFFFFFFFCPNDKFYFMGRNKIFTTNTSRHITINLGHIGWNKNVKT